MRENDWMYCLECSVSTRRFRIKQLRDIINDNQRNILTFVNSDYQLIGTFKSCIEAKRFCRIFKKNYNLPYPCTVSFSAPVKTD